MTSFDALKQTFVKLENEHNTNRKPYVLLQTPHWNGRSSVCAVMCFFSLLAVKKALPHWSQIADLNTTQNKRNLKLMPLDSNRLNYLRHEISCVSVLIDAISGTSCTDSIRTVAAIQRANG